METEKEKSKKNSEATIQLITFLYCEGALKESENCMSKKCMDGQCMCMDTEQLGLLLSRMFDDRGWNPADLNDSAFVHVLTVEEENKVRCHQQVLFDFEIRLIKCRKAGIQYRKVKEPMKKAAPEKMRSLLKMLPIIKMTNVSHKFNERYSFVYICTFGDYAATFVEQFMAMMIGYVIDQYCLGKEIIPILKKMEFFFELLLRVNTEGVYDACVKELIEQIDGYYDFMSLSKKGAISAYAQYMWDFREKIKESNANHHSADDVVALLYPDDEVEFVHLCHLLKIILKIIEIEYTFEVGNLQLYMNEKSECKHDFYDELESILIGEKNSDIVRKKYVFRMLKKMFDKYGSWSDEDLIQLRQNICN